MKTRFQPDASAYHDYYLKQAGRGFPVYAGRPYQRGHGLGSIIGSLFKSAVPMLKRGAKALGKEALKTGLGIASDALEGQNVKQAAQTRAKRAGRNLLQQSVQQLSPPGERTIKRAPRKKKTRRSKTVKQRGPQDIFA